MRRTRESAPDGQQPVAKLTAGRERTARRQDRERPGSGLREPTTPTRCNAADDSPISSHRTEREKIDGELRPQENCRDGTGGRTHPDGDRTPLCALPSKQPRPAQPLATQRPALPKATSRHRAQRTRHRTTEILNTFEPPLQKKTKKQKTQPGEKAGLPPIGQECVSLSGRARDGGIFLLPYQPEIFFL